MNPSPTPDAQDLGPIDDQTWPGEPAEGTVVRNHTGLIAWIVSGSLHATLAMLMGTIYFMVQEDQIETPPAHIVIAPAPRVTPEVKPPADRRLLESSIDLKLDAADTVAPKSDLILTADLTSSEDETETDSPVPKSNNEEAIASAEMGGPGVFMTLGVGGPSAGAFGRRHGSGHKRAVSAGGGSRRSEGAVNAALRWFKRHQSPNGMWDAERYFQNCTEEVKCEPGSLENYAAEQVNVAMTGYALLAFLGSGYDHRSPNTYKMVVRKGLDYLLSAQKPDGLLGARNYEHPIAAMALAEAYAMSNDPELRAPAQKAIAVILARQNPDDGAAAKAGQSSSGGLGWDYQNPGKRNDASVTGWNVMALKSAHAGGLDVGTGITSAKAWLERAWKANNDGQEGRPDWQQLDPYTQTQSLFSYCWNGSAGYVKDMGHQNMAPVGLACAVFMGHQAGDPMLESLANFVAKRQTPTAYPTNTYYLYYNTLGMFQVGGEKWVAWNAAVRDLLVNAQRKGEGCFDGSWDFEGTGFHGHKIGRVLSTAYCALSLEVYYRYELMQKEKEKQKGGKGRLQAANQGL